MATAPASALSAGARFRAALAEERPLQVVGAINAYVARMAAATGFRAIYLSGGGVAANSLGVPDLGISTMDDVLIDIRRITDACALPLLVDADTGWGGALNIARTVRSLHQGRRRRTAHRGSGAGQALRPPARQGNRPATGNGGSSQGGGRRAHRRAFVVMARTDALALEGIDRAIERAVACVEAGADMIFPEAITELAMYRRFKAAGRAPVLANITEFGKTPLYTRPNSARRASTSCCIAAPPTAP